MRRTDYSGHNPGMTLLSRGWWARGRGGYATLAVIAAAAIAFFVCQWLLLPPASASNPEAPLAAAPGISYSQAISDTSVETNASITLRFRLRRLTGDAGHGGITVSFPDLDRANSSGSSSSYDSVDGSVSTKRYTNGASKVSYFPSGYSPIHNEDGSTGTAGHLIVESDDTDWPARDYRILELNFTPKQSGSFRIYYRFWLCGDQYDDCTRRPHSSQSDQVDQQGWHVGVYTVDVTNQASGPFARNSAEDFDTLDAADNESPKGIWSDETTMWVADWSDEKIYAYSMSNKGRVSSKDFDTLDDAGNDNPEGIWSDGTTMWVVDSSDAKIYAYNMSNKARVSSKDFDTLDAAGNDSPEGIWSDGTTMWVADWSDEKIYAYNMSNKARVSSKDFDTLDAASNGSPTGIWSDGTTMWVADSSDDKIYAYDMSNKGRVSSKDFDTLDAASNGSPTGIWSDRETVWVADSSDDKIYAYHAPEMAPAPSPANRAPSVLLVSPQTPLSLDADDSQTFTARASDPDDNLKRYEWFVNDQSEDSGVWRLFLPTGSVDKSFSHTFSTAGPYTVKATFTDDDGESASVTWDVTIRQVTPTIQVTQSISDTSVHVNESVTVRLRMRRLSGSSGNGGITVSFRDLDQANSSGSPLSSYDSADGSVSTTSYTNGTSKVHYFASGYFPIHNQDGTTGTVSYLIVESDDTDWPDSDYRTLELSFTPKKHGTYEIYYRFWLCGNQYDDCRRLPDSIREDQQQGWHVGVYTITVTPTSTGPPRAEITSCGASPENPTVKDEWVPVATVTNHSYSGLLPTEFYVEFTISDTARGLELPVTKSTTKTPIQVGNAHTFEGPAASWPEDDKEQRQQDGSHQLPLFPLKWFPGEITVKCELKADDNWLGDNRVHTLPGTVTITDFQRNSADAKIATCAPSRRPVLSGEAPTLQADTMYLPNNKGLTLFAVEYWVHHEGLRVHHSGDDVKPESTFPSESKWGTAEPWETPRDWIDLSSQDLPLGTYTLDCALWGHRISDAYKRFKAGNVAYDWLVKLVQGIPNPIEKLIEVFTGPLSPKAEVQILEREFSKWTNKDDYSLQGLVSTEFSVVEARWGADGLSIERGTETLPDGRERIRVRVNREETKDRVGERIPAPYIHIKGPMLEQIPEATSCEEGNQDHGTYLSLCWEKTFDIPVNDTINERVYTLTVDSFFIEDDQAGSFTVEASPDAAALKAFYDATGGQHWGTEAKAGWLSNAPIGDWYGVDTDTRGRVVKLDFRGSDRRGSGLQGSIPADLKDTLPFLQTLYLEGNNGLTKCIPEILFGVQTNDLVTLGVTLGLPTCEDTCAWGAALPDPDNGDLVADCEALLQAHNSLAANSASDALDWSTRKPIGGGGWRGVRLDGSPERVVGLEIAPPPQLWGYLSSELARLSNLQTLDLSDNRLLGKIPDEFKDLTNLHTLNLQGNQLTGGIPRELSGLTNLRILDLSDNDLSGRIPANLTNLVNLGTLHLGGNQFDGCIPAALRDVTSNDLAGLGLPFCDVLLSGLTINPGVLTPQFDPGQSDYTAETNASQVTVTPTNDHNATFQFFDDDILIPDADGILQGHQVDVSDGNATIRVIVTSQDTEATHTYVIEVIMVGLPGAPVIAVPITLGPASLTVSWTPPAGGTAITSYDLRYIESDAADKADANWTGRNNIWSSGALRYDLGGLTNGVSYDVLVRAVNAVGHGPWSPAATGTPRTTPGAPVIDSLIPGGGALNVGWSDPATDGGAEVTGYDLRFIRSDAPDKADANWTGRSGIWSSGPLRYDLGGLTDGVGYDVQVRAANAAGHGQWSGSITVTPHTMPTAPAIVSVDAGDGALIITWTEPADIGGLNIQGYDVRYIPAEENNPGATWTEEQDIWTLGSLEHTITGLTNGVRYDLELRAVTSAGDGPWSSAFSATPKTTPDVPIISLITPDGSTLTVAWDAPANTGGSAITSYDLRYIESGAIDKADANWTEVVSAWSTGPLSYAFGSLTGGTPYDVQVRAVNASGPGLWSATFAGTPVTIRASRSFSPAPVSAGGELEVTITAAGYGGFGGVVETLPIGFSYVYSSLSDSAVTVAGQEVSFTLFGETAFTYTVAAPSAEGTYSFSGVLKHSNRVEQPVGGVSSITVEAGALSVSITRSATTLMRIGLAIPVTAAFSKPVSGFAVEDVSVTNGGVSNFAGSGRDYAFDVTPNAIGKVTVDIAAGAATDAGGNGNAAAGQLALGIPYDDDGNGAIGKSEVVTAINDYLFGEGDEAISKSDVITLINLYLFG